MNLEFAQAQHIINKEKEFKNNGITVLHENYIDFLRIIINEEKSYFLDKEKLKLTRINQLKSYDPNSPFYLFAQAEIHLQWAIARLKFEQYITAGYEINKAYSLLKKNQELFPEFKLNKKSLAVLKILIGTIPSDFAWIPKLIGMHGNVQEGLRDLRDLSSLVKNDIQFNIYDIEIIFLSAFLEMSMQNNSSTYIDILNQIGDRYKTNILLNFTASRLASKIGKNDLAIKILLDQPVQKESIPFYYMDYVLAMKFLYKLNYKNAKFYFKKFLANYKGLNYIKSTYHKLALISYLEKEEYKMRQYYDKVIKFGVRVIDEDKKSDKEAKKNSMPNKILLKVRLLYDGGYYDLAEEQLNLISDLNSIKATDLSEYYYRKGQISSLLNQSKINTLKFFRKSFVNINSSTNHFGPNSLLNIALIYEDQNQKDSSQVYYKKCLNLSGFDYQRGIHRKAKAGLNRIGY